MPAGIIQQETYLVFLVRSDDTAQIPQVVIVHADKVIVMDDGKVVMQGTPREVFSKVAELKKHRLDVPQVTELAYELQKAGVPLPNGILTVEEFTEALLAVKEKQ